MTEPTTPTGKLLAAGNKHVRQSVNGCVLCERRWDDHIDTTDEDILAIESEARQQGAKEERERLSAEFHAYWEWLVEQRIYGQGGGWGEAAMLKVSDLLSKP
jgi:hypothetical protein